MFHDRARIHVQAGRGGDGALSFRREKHVPKRGPDGGDGGPGGDVVLVADPDLRDLSSFRARRWFAAGKGGAGGGSGKHGATGEEIELRVPVGTQVLDADEQLMADLATLGARVVLASGGEGGIGVHALLAAKGGARQWIPPPEVYVRRSLKKIRNISPASPSPIPG